MYFVASRSKCCKVVVDEGVEEFFPGQKEEPLLVHLFGRGFGTNIRQRHKLYTLGCLHEKKC